jgi:hypothetical protein
LRERSGAGASGCPPAAAAEDRFGGLTSPRTAVLREVDTAVIALGRVAADVEVLAPPELVEHTRVWVRRLNAAAIASASADKLPRLRHAVVKPDGQPSDATPARSIPTG